MNDMMQGIFQIVGIIENVQHKDRCDIVRVNSLVSKYNPQTKKYEDTTMYYDIVFGKDTITDMIGTEIFIKGNIVGKLNPQNYVNYSFVAKEAYTQNILSHSNVKTSVSNRTTLSKSSDEETGNSLPEPQINEEDEIPF